MAWYSFKSKQEFTSWHNELKKSLSYPKDEITTEYTSGIVLAEDNVVAWVDPENAEGLTKTNAPISPAFGEPLYEEIF